MFDNLFSRITSPTSRRRYTYHCPEIQSDPEDAEPVTPRKPRLLERRKRGKRLETGLRQARSLGRLDGLKEVSVYINIFLLLQVKKECLIYIKRVTASINASILSAMKFSSSFHLFWIQFSDILVNNEQRKKYFVHMGFVVLY